MDQRACVGLILSAARSDKVMYTVQKIDVKYKNRQSCSGLKTKLGAGLPERILFHIKLYFCKV